MVDQWHCRILATGATISTTYFLPIILYCLSSLGMLAANVGAVALPYPCYCCCGYCLNHISSEKQTVLLYTIIIIIIIIIIILPSVL